MENKMEEIFGKLVDKYESLSEDATLDELTILTDEINIQNGKIINFGVAPNP